MKIEITADVDVYLSEVYSGVGIRTSMGVFGIAQRDDGIEVMLEGKTVWTSHGLPGGSEERVPGNVQEVLLASSHTVSPPRPQKGDVFEITEDFPLNSGFKRSDIIIVLDVHPDGSFLSAGQRGTWLLHSSYLGPLPNTPSAAKFIAMLAELGELRTTIGPRTGSVPARPVAVAELVSLPDGSGTFTASWPLPKDHWLYTDHDNDPPAPMRIGVGPERDELARQVKNAARHAIRASTMNGKKLDFDPDAMVQNMIVGLLGKWTKDGR